MVHQSRHPMMRTLLLLFDSAAALNVISMHAAPPHLTTSRTIQPRMHAAPPHLTTSRTIQPRIAEIDFVDDSSYKELVVAQSHTIPVVVDFFADYCRPCKRILPLLEKLHETGEVIVVKADLSTRELHEHTGALRAMILEQDASFEVEVLPTIILFQNGQAQGKLSGSLSFTDAKLNAFVAEAVASLSGVVTPSTPTRPAVDSLEASPPAGSALHGTVHSLAASEPATTLLPVNPMSPAADYEHSAWPASRARQPRDAAARRAGRWLERDQSVSPKGIAMPTRPAVDSLEASPPTGSALHSLAASEPATTVVPINPMSSTTDYEHVSGKRMVCREGACRVVHDNPANGKHQPVIDKSRRTANANVVSEPSRTPRQASLARRLASAKKTDSKKIGIREIGLDVCRRAR